MWASENMLYVVNMMQFPENFPLVWELIKCYWTSTTIGGSSTLIARVCAGSSYLPHMYKYAHSVEQELPVNVLAIIQGGTSYILSSQFSVYDEFKVLLVFIYFILFVSFK